MQPGQLVECQETIIGEWGDCCCCYCVSPLLKECPPPSSSHLLLLIHTEQVGRGINGLKTAVITLSELGLRISSIAAVKAAILLSQCWKIPMLPASGFWCHRISLSWQNQAAVQEGRRRGWKQNREKQSWTKIIRVLLKSGGRNKDAGERSGLEQLLSPDQRCDLFTLRRRSLVGTFLHTHY